MPTLPPDWARTLDTLRPPRPKDIAPWEWRNGTPPKPVVFEPINRMTDEVSQLHLEHPFVRRALSRFTAQGYATHDLHRVALVRYRGTHERLVLIARMSLFGAGATRLHDSLVHLVAELRGEAPPIPLDNERSIADTLAGMRAGLAAHADWQPAQAFVARHRQRLAQDLALLWPKLEREAKQEALELTRLLDDRGAREAEQLVHILTNQQHKIATTLASQPDELAGNDPVARQRRLDRKHMLERRDALGRELELEPPRLRAHYRVASQRIEAVGLVYLIPETR